MFVQSKEITMGKKKDRKKFVIRTFGVTSNTVTNIPRVKRHAHLWRLMYGGIKCVDCGEQRTGYFI